MNSEASSVAIAAVLDAVSLLRGEVAALSRSNERLEQSHQHIHRRLDEIEAGQAPIADLIPFQETILAKTLEGDSTTHDWLGMLGPVLEKILEKSERDREAFDELRRDVRKMADAHTPRRDGNDEIVAGLELIAGRLDEAVSDSRKQRTVSLTAIAELVGFTRAAALGFRVPLPIDLEDDPLFEGFLLNQPADLASTERALVDWRAAVADAGTADLVMLLRTQQQPSPTDTRQTRLLRYRLSAITRAQIEGRGATPPPRPKTTRAPDRLAVACIERSQQLAELWRAGESTALYAEPELAGAIDLFDAAERRIGSPVDGKSPPELVAFHRELADRIASGDRPMLGSDRQAAAYVPHNTMEQNRDR
ncbi:hypothetical protein QLH51_04325 [Sphingomonas sp. 2R-10]|uniref:hypothetical protein n=1 Tax=Sphingomonas sp. 2R-10 TaxID=3045148 RepID=UPI0024BA2F4F|nr:hypothetical protein [Sphingomonas sp. 2R-10]MDJ0276030.1 hypothetical protein [Sphingomonas sp. 2R-10]